jgi:hypothetical protein
VVYQEEHAVKPYPYVLGEKLESVEVFQVDELLGHHVQETEAHIYQNEEMSFYARMLSEKDDGLLCENDEGLDGTLNRVSRERSS